MNLCICAIYDTKAKAHLTPFFVPNTAVAVRAFAGAVNAPRGSSPVADNPADFILFHFGTWNDENGTFSLLSAPDNLGLGAQFRREVWTPKEQTIPHYEQAARDGIAPNDDEGRN